MDEFGLTFEETQRHGVRLTARSRRGPKTTLRSWLQRFRLGTSCLSLVHCANQSLSRLPIACAPIWGSPLVAPDRF